LAEDFTEDVERIVETTAAGLTAATTTTGTLEGGMTIAVVSGALFRVFQDFVGFGNFFKCFLSLLVARIFIGVKLHGLFTVGLLEFFFGRAFWRTEEFVVIFLRHRDRGCQLRAKRKQRIG